LFAGGGNLGGHFGQGLLDSAAPSPAIDIVFTLVHQHASLI
jgi:hypothetical protein